MKSPTAKTGDAAENAATDEAHAIAAELESDEKAAINAAEKANIAAGDIDENSVAETRDIQEINAGLVEMTHPDGGSSDHYEATSTGSLLVPVQDIAMMIDHGFVVAAN